MKIVGLQKKENDESISNVSSGGRGSATIKIGGTHYLTGLRVQAAGVAATQAEMRRDIKEVFVSVNGVQVYTGQSAAEILDMFAADVANMSALGTPAIDGLLPLPYVDLRLDPVSMMTKAIGTVGVNTFKIKLIYGDDASFSLTDIDVDCWVTPEARTFNGGNIIRWDSYEWTPAGAGDHAYDGLEVTANDSSYKDLIVTSTNAVETKVTVVVTDNGGNETTIRKNFDEIDEALEGLFADSAPQSGRLHLRFDKFRLKDALLSQADLKSIKLKFNFAADPGAVKIVTRRTVVAKAS